MTEEELREEATSTVEWESVPMIDRPLFVFAYVKGALTREKRIEELEAQIEKMQEKLKADLIANLKERIQYSTSPSCTKGMELFIKSIEKWEMGDKRK